jgi:predicted DNA-binding protein YlxM (UPF0122 family)
MAYTESQWEKARAYYEAGMSLSQIKDKTNIARNTISQRAKREQWEHSKNSDYIEAKIKVETQKGTILEQSGTVALNIADDIALDKAKSITLFQNSALKNQKKANELLELTDDMKDIESHARITKTNKETVLGKEIDTIINNTNAQQNNENKLVVEFK